MPLTDPSKIAELNCRFAMSLVAYWCAIGGIAIGQAESGSEHSPIAAQIAADSASSEIARPTLEELKVAGALQSSYRKYAARSEQNVLPETAQVPQARLDTFRKDVEPVLQAVCVQCHGAETQEGNIRIDTLDPDLFHGSDVNWWLEVLAVLSNGEMPPVDEVEMTDHDRSKVVEWLSSEIQLASAVRRAEEGHSSFRRMTAYEYNYALQDLLGLPYNFAKDLPPESSSEDGFQNSSETLHMSTVQFGTYRESALSALRKATVRGEQPAPIYWGVSMKDASAVVWSTQDGELDQIKREYKDDPDKQRQELDRQAARFRGAHGRAYYKNLANDRTGQATWDYGGAKYAWTPSATKPEVPTSFDHVAIVPPRQKLIVELGDTVPDSGTLRVRIRASRTSVDDARNPSLQLEFGWQASNDSDASVRVSRHDLVIDAAPDQPRFYQWDIPLSEIYPRNSMRRIWKMGDLPSPSEFVKFVNSSVSHGDIQFDYVEITAPVYEQWPPDSHTRIFIDSENKRDETSYAREVLGSFMARAWRGQVTTSEVDQKLALFHKIRPQCHDLEDAMLEVLATVLSSPKFLYLVQSDSNPEHEPADARSLSPEELATRLAMFLWCSTPDDELLELAEKGRLSDAGILAGQVSRMLADPRSRRFSEHFVRQWLGMELLDYLDIDQQTYPQFDSSLKEAMQEEPIAFFHGVLQNNDSIVEFIHADYAMVNERLAMHYRLPGVYGNDFRRVQLAPHDRRGGLLTQSGLLAMNSDGKDSHPLKRGIWMLKNLLNDPPPPPPPAVPKIDLADPEIAKLTLKQRIEDHRNQAACMSCHAKIDPWGIAFENYDAVGSWRTEIDEKPVDPTSRLFNGQQLDGVDGLKRFLLQNRQDQLVRAMSHKMTTYAIGRPLNFGDHSSVDQITAELRRQGDGLATLVNVIVANELFQSK